MRTLAGGSSGASAMFGHLSDVGLQLQGDGSMTVNDSKLANALGNVAELKKMFSNSNLLDASQDGFGKRFRAVTDSMLGIDGALTTKTDSLGKQLQRNHNDQDTLQTRLDGIEKRMRAQYTALDATMALLNSKSNYITQQIAAFNANSSSSK
jgi:flagellar hook-associated protein 2